MPRLDRFASRWNSLAALILSLVFVTACDPGTPSGADNESNANANANAVVSPNGVNRANGGGDGAGRGANPAPRIDIGAEVLAVARTWRDVRLEHHSTYLRYAWSGGAPTADDEAADDVEAQYAAACDLAPDLERAVAALLSKVGTAPLFTLTAGDLVAALARDDVDADSSGLTTQAMLDRAALETLLALPAPILAHARAHLPPDADSPDHLNDTARLGAALTATAGLLEAIAARSLSTRAMAQSRLLETLAQTRSLLSRRPPTADGQVGLRAALIGIARAWARGLVTTLRAQQASDAARLDDAVAAGADLRDPLRRYYLIVEALDMRDVLPVGEDIDAWAADERAHLATMYNALAALAEPLASPLDDAKFDRASAALHAVRDRALAFEAEFTAPDAAGAIAGRLATRLLPVIEGELKLLSACAATDVVGALERARAEETLYPVRLMLMAPKYLPRAPFDPATGLEWRFSRRPGEPYYLASLGLDGEDEGGQPPGDWPFQPE